MKRYTFRHTKNMKPRKVLLLLGSSTQVRVLFPLQRKPFRNERFFCLPKTQLTAKRAHIRCRGHSFESLPEQTTKKTL